SEIVMAKLVAHDPQDVFSAGHGGTCRMAEARWSDIAPRLAIASGGRHAGDVDRERIAERDLLEPVEAAGCAAVTGVHVGAEDNRRRSGAQLAQPRDPFRW